MALLRPGIFGGIGINTGPALVTSSGQIDAAPFGLSNIALSDTTLNVYQNSPPGCDKNSFSLAVDSLPRILFLCG